MKTLEAEISNLTTDLLDLWDLNRLDAGTKTDIQSAMREGIIRMLKRTAVEAYLLDEAYTYTIDE